MKIIINNPKAINHIGGRNNNEDSIYPLLGNATANDKLFLVCDGVGGSEKGEVASRIVCDKFAEYFNQNPIDESNEAYIDMALQYTENAFDNYIAENPDSKGMGTTLTLLNFHKNGAAIAHIGDSRVYQFRNGQIMFQTSDHSLVNDLFKAGVINEEQAKDHPRKNVISRAIQGNVVKPTNADVSIITDLQAGDYFFLCSDGILENITDFEIGQILSENISNDDKMEQISKRCKENPNDNFSAYLVQLENVEGFASSKSEETLIDAVVDEPEAEVITEAEIEEQMPEKKSLISKLKKLLPIIMILTGLLLVIFWFMKPEKKGKPENQKPNIEQANQKPDLKRDKPKVPDGKNQETQNPELLKSETQQTNVKDSKGIIEQVTKPKKLLHQKENDSIDTKIDTDKNHKLKDNR
jgi:PPM family protein phosphatase